ncbi:hypothetical protein GCM10023322_57550 [Rugosimonospora acidiphila]|uniref:Uncharacterized protein n=1 Tax=Rugosimonospora acidiphila TaxID=556531 RepID=A0ABP9SC59_9ACTN
MYSGRECARLEGTRKASAAAPLAPPAMIAVRGAKGRNSSAEIPITAEEMPKTRP